eukprot:Skav230587  [mRNA]  locus=scaffold1455:84802:86119:- [translate_table: standard]
MRLLYQDEAKEIGHSVGASFRELRGKMRKDGCFSCSGRPKSFFLRSVTITERAYPDYNTSGQTLSTTVGIEHEKDTRLSTVRSHVWYRTQTQVCGCCWM